MLSSSSLPLSVPGTTVDRQCGSSQQALHFAVQAVMSGTQDIVIAGGAESMSSVPMMSNLPKGLGKPNSDVCQNKFGRGRFYSQFVGAELIGKSVQRRNVLKLLKHSIAGRGLGRVERDLHRVDEARFARPFVL